MRFRSRSVSAWLGVVALTATAWAEAQIDTRVEIDPAIECWYHDAHPSLDAAVDPSGDIARTRLYFRCMDYADYYFVDLTPSGDDFRAVAPKAEESCAGVTYYVEVVRTDFTSARTPERQADVTSLGECQRRNPAVAFFDGEPNLLVGTTSPNLLQLLGFKSDGVFNFLAASGEVTSIASGAVGGGGGGGVSSGVIIGAGAAAAGGAAIFAAVGGSSSEEPEETTTTPPSTSLPPPPAPPTTPPPAPPTDAPVTACIETTPTDATIRAGESISLDGRCSTGGNLSFSWDLGDGRPPRTGAFVRPVYREPGVFTVTLTVTQEATGALGMTGRSSRMVDTETVNVRVEAAPLTACFDTKVLTPGTSCDIEFDARCSEGDITRYEWLLDSTNALGFGTVPENGVVTSHDWGGACGGMPPWPNIQTVLTVFDADGNSATASRSVSVQTQQTSSSEATRVPARFVSTLASEPADGSKAAQVHHNERQVDTLSNAGPFQHRFDGHPGVNEVMAHVLAPLERPALWRFDFRGVPGFVPGSIHVRSGQAVSVGARSVVFRTTGAPGERIRFVYSLSP